VSDVTGPPATAGDLVALGARRAGRAVAVQDRDGRSVTYAGLDERSNRLAQALLAQGLGRGDRVAAWMEDCREYVELYLAAAKAGLVMVPINARYRAGEAAHQLGDSGAAALVWTAGLNGEVARLGLAPSDLVTIATDPAADARHSYDDVLAAGAPVRPPAPEPDDLFILGYTSGTTGAPKGAMLTHRSVLAIARLNALSYRLPPGSVAALTGSMSFVATVPAHVLSHLFVGGRAVIMGRWDPDTLLATVRRERATFTYVPTPLLDDVTAALAADAAAAATLVSVLHSASKAEPRRLAALAAVIGDRFVEGWGMTENSGGLVTATTRADVRGDTAAADVFASAGRAVPESVVEVVDGDGQPLPHDGSSVGELVVRSPALLAGYWHNPAATAAALHDGWYRSGDLGCLDPAGYVYLTDRRTDLIVTGGMNVYPSEVERCLAALAGVRECAVVGVPHERWGQTVTAAVVARPEAALSEAAVVDHCRRHLAGFKKPTAVVFLDALPRTPNLKVARAELRQLLTERLQAAPAGQAG